MLKAIENGDPRVKSVYETILNQVSSKEEDVARDVSLEELLTKEGLSGEEFMQGLGLTLAEFDSIWDKTYVVTNTLSGAVLNFQSEADAQAAMKLLLEKHPDLSLRFIDNERELTFMYGKEDVSSDYLVMLEMTSYLL